MLRAEGQLALSLLLRFSMVPPSEASPISVKLLALSVDIILQESSRILPGAVTMSSSPPPPPQGQNFGQLCPCASHIPLLGHIPHSKHLVFIPLLVLSNPRIV